jgi:hypothetical protein
MRHVKNCDLYVLTVESVIRSLKRSHRHGNRDTMDPLDALLHANEDVDANLPSTEAIHAAVQSGNNPQLETDDTDAQGGRAQ